MDISSQHFMLAKLFTILLGNFDKNVNSCLEKTKHKMINKKPPLSFKTVDLETRRQKKKKSFTSKNRRLLPLKGTFVQLSKAT